MRCLKVGVASFVLAGFARGAGCESLVAALMAVCGVAVGLGVAALLLRLLRSDNKGR
jgi:hypothetical protein